MTQRNPGKCLTAFLLALTLLTGGALADTFLLLDVGEDADVVDAEYNDDGSYFEEIVVDAQLTVVRGRYAADVGKAGDLGAYLWRRSVETGDVTAVSIEPVSGYAAGRYTFVSGAGETPRAQDEVYIYTDEWVFYARFSVPVDFADVYAAKIQGIIDSLEIEDEGEF